MAVRVVQAAHQAQQRAEAETEAVAMAEDMRMLHNRVVPVLVIFLTIPALDAPVVEAVVEAFPAMVQLTQKPKAAAYRMAEKEGHKTERLPGLPAAARVAVAAALVVLMATAALAALVKCISASIFKGGVIMDYCIVNSEGIIVNIIVCEDAATAETFGAVESYEGACIGNKYEPPIPVTQLDRIEAQSTYTAMMTGTLLEG